MAKRRIKHANVTRLALCKRGKNGLATLFKSDGTMQLDLLVKQETGVGAEGRLLAVAYPLGLADSDGDIADTAEAIKSMAHSFMRSGAQLDIEHDGKILPREMVFVAESFIIQKSDERFKSWPTYNGKAVDVTGGWGVDIQIDDPGLRAARARGDLDGVSLLGTAAVEQIDVKAASERVAALMGGKEQTMTPEQLAAALAAHEAKLVEMVKSAVAEALKPKQDAKPEAPKPDAAPEFTGDPTNPADLEAFEKALRRHELTKAIKSGSMTADQLATLRKNLTSTEPSIEELREAGIPAKDEDSKEVRDLQRKLFKAQAGSNAPQGKSRSDTDAEALSKAQAVEAKLLGDLLNTNLGNSSPASGMKIVAGR